MQKDEHRLTLPHFFVMNRNSVYLHKPAVRVCKFTFRDSPGQRCNRIKQRCYEQNYSYSKHDNTENFPKALHGFFPEKPETTTSYSMSPEPELPRGKAFGIITDLSISVAGLHQSGVLIAGHLQPGNQSRFLPG